ncbi:DUF4219 domain-containing protein [Cephalotus follicularis]|uniref:DUF4219 domain-containing protein n=1 Tax=Cephalotus follicularis TaxID=3775 RepID=A0A1Q3APK5_CEPFO|nr:DUF4219 domain-containing protein [Cephalotus follicularis]
MASSSHAYLPAPPVFRGENYEFWSVKMKAFLRAYDLWEIVEKGYEPPAETDVQQTVAQFKKQKEESSKNFKDLSFLHSAVAESIFSRIVGAATLQEAWNTLQKEFQGPES